MVGLGYAFVDSSLWPAVPLLVDPRMTGTALGLLQTFQAKGLFLSYLFFGFFADKSGDWTWSLIFLVTTSGIPSYSPSSCVTTTEIVVFWSYQPSWQIKNINDCILVYL